MRDLFQKRPSEEFDEILEEIVSDIHTVSLYDDQLSLDGITPKSVYEIYSSLPYSAQETMRVDSVLEYDSNFALSITFDNNCWNKNQERIEFHKSLTTNERLAVKETIREICEDKGAKFDRVRGDEFLVRAATLEDLHIFIRFISSQIDAILKYIAPSPERSKVYKLYFKKSKENNPIESRYVYARTNTIFECPKCKNKAVRSATPDESPSTFCCSSCGLAAHINYTSVKQDIEPDMSKKQIKSICEDRLQDVYQSKDKINIKSDLEYVGRNENTVVYEDVGVYGEQGELIELWVQREDSPVAIYNLFGQEFLATSSAPITVSTCDFCGEKKDVFNISGVYYEEGVGIHEETIDICESCRTDLLKALRNILIDSDKSSDYIKHII